MTFETTFCWQRVCVLHRCWHLFFHAQFLRYVEITPIEGVHISILLDCNATYVWYDTSNCYTILDVFVYFRICHYLVAPKISWFCSFLFLNTIGIFSDTKFSTTCVLISLTNMGRYESSTLHTPQSPESIAFVLAKVVLLEVWLLRMRLIAQIYHIERVHTAYKYLGKLYFRSIQINIEFETLPRRNTHFITVGCCHLPTGFLSRLISGTWPFCHLPTGLSRLISGTWW